MNKMDFQPSIRQDFLKGINGGISVRYTSEKYFGMICAAQIEANFSQRGWKENFDDDTDNSYSRTLNYLEIPFLAHLSWGKETRGLQFFVNLGPQFGFFLSDSEKYKGNWNIEERPQSIRPVYGKSVEKIFDYGITGGLGLELKTKAGNFFIEGRYYYGLSDIYPLRCGRFSRAMKKASTDTKDTRPTISKRTLPCSLITVKRSMRWSTS